MKLKSVLLLTSAIFLLGGCGGEGEGSSSTSSTSLPPQPVEFELTAGEYIANGKGGANIIYKFDETAKTVTFTYYETFAKYVAGEASETSIINYSFQVEQDYLRAYLNSSMTVLYKSYFYSFYYQDNEGVKGDLRLRVSKDGSLTSYCGLVPFSEASFMKLKDIADGYYQSKTTTAYYNQGESIGEQYFRVLKQGYKIEVWYRKEKTSSCTSITSFVEMDCFFSDAIGYKEKNVFLSDLIEESGTFAVRQEKETEASLRDSYFVPVRVYFDHA